MKLAENTVTEYLEVLGSDAPAPGGGSASALCGAQGAALVAMVAGLTIGKVKYAADQELCAEIALRTYELRDELLSQVDRDTEAFNLVSAAYRLPKSTDLEKEARKKVIRDATKEATEVPFKTMELGLEALQCAKKLVGHSNVNAASDLGVAALNLLACVKGAWLNVLINIGGLEEAAAQNFRTGGEKTVTIAQGVADEIYRAVSEGM